MSVVSQLRTYIKERCALNENKVRKFPTIGYNESKFIFEEFNNDKEKNPYILGRIKAILLKTDIKTQNNTYYSTEWSNRVLFDNENFQNRLIKKLIGGELDHPEQPGTSTGNVAFSVIKLWKENENEIWGTIEIFNTTAGQDMWALLKAGVILGFSLRGLGNDRYENGVNVIESEGFELIGWDAVWDPSVIGAEFKSFTENRKKKFINEMTKIKEDSNMAKKIMENINKTITEEKKSKDAIFENNQLKTKIGVVEKSVKSIKEERDNLKTELVITKKQINENKEMIQTGKLRLESKNKRVANLEEQIETLKTEKKILVDQLTDKEMKIEQIKKEFTEKNQPKENIVQILVEQNHVNENNKSTASLIKNAMRANMPRRNNF